MHNQRFKVCNLILLSFLFFMLFGPGCRLYRLEKKLEAKYEDFLSEVRYIITPEERKIYLELPDSEKEHFEEEFWKRRDPDPDTEENEFKQEYFARMKRANELFPSEGRPGWLTDRGRIYILFGPPLDRIANAAYDTGERCSEVWYYGNFPVVFVDKYCRGEYVLVTYDLTGIRAQDLAYMHDLNKVQNIMQHEPIVSDQPLFDFNWRIKKKKISAGRVTAIINLEFPYSKMALDRQIDRLETELELFLELKNFEGITIWSHKDFLKVAINESELKIKRNPKCKHEISLSLEDGLTRLGQSPGRLYILVKNRTGEQELTKVMDFSIR